MIDAGDFNGVLLDLVNGDEGRKDQFAPPAHASGAATVGKVAQRCAAVIDGFHCLPSGGGIVFLDLREICGEICAPCLPRRVLTTGLPSASGLEQPVDPLPHLLVREIFAALQGCFAKLDGFNKASFLREIAADSFLRKRARVAASMRGQFRELVLLLRREMYFHKRQCKSATSTCQRTYWGGGAL